MTSTETSSPNPADFSEKRNFKFISMRYFSTFSFFIALLFALTGCASTSKKNTPPPPAPISLKLPKPAPMRVAIDTSNRRKAPLLPKIVDTSTKSDSPTSAVDELVPPSETKTVSSAVPKFIENDQPEDFFQGVGDAPSGEAVLGGGFFDTVFRPAAPPNQPVSTATYTTSD